jgi:hypothetical protein
MSRFVIVTVFFSYTYNDNQFCISGNCKCIQNVDLNSFGRWGITLRITGFLDLIHRPEF